MYVFAIALLVGLGVAAIAMFAERFLTRIPELWAAAFVALGVAFAWITGFDVWRLWGMHARADWVAITTTGIMLGGVALAWHALLGLSSGLLRKVNDEAATMERDQGLQRVA